jgi:hypothetical protein
LVAAQWAALVVGLMQTPPHSTCGSGQVTAQLPPMQILPSREQSMPGNPGGAAALQSPVAPQKLRLLVGSMHALPHTICPPGQAHVPPVQRAPVPTKVPHTTPSVPADPAPGVQAPEAPQ